MGRMLYDDMQGRSKQWILKAEITDYHTAQLVRQCARDGNIDRQPDI